MNDQSSSEKTNEKARTVLEKYRHFFSTLFCLIQETGKLFLLEGKLAKSSVTAIFFYSLIFIIFALSAWMTAAALSVIGFYYLTKSWIFSLLLSAGINFIAAFLVLYRIGQLRKNLSFPYTRKIFSGNKREPNKSLKTSN